MDPMIGRIIVFAVLAVIVFFSARSTIRRIKAEIRGECSCSGCSGCNDHGGNTPECCACMKQMEKLRDLKNMHSQN